MTADTLSATAPGERRRRPTMRAFYIGAAIDLVLGIELLLFADWLAAALLPEQPQLLGLATPVLLRITGLVLLLIAVETVLMARSQGWLRPLLPSVVVLNWASVAACIILLAIGYQALSAFGLAVLTVLGGLGIVLALGQQRALRADAAGVR